MNKLNEKGFLWLAFDATDNYRSHGGKGLLVDTYVWAAPDRRAQLDQALANGYIEIIERDVVGRRGVITDLGRQRLRALGGFDGTPMETIRYTQGSKETR